MPHDPLMLALAFITALAAGAMNSIAGGGTLLTFPILLWLGLDGKTANVTSTIGLVAGSLSGAWGFRKEMRESGELVWPFFLASMVGGAVGSVILLVTGNKQFETIVPWLILLATGLFASQALVRRMTQHENRILPTRWPLVTLIQFGVGVYGGFFGAGMGILMLAILGFLGLSNIHLMNGIKNFAAGVINGVAIIIFTVASLRYPDSIKIDWLVALVMVLGSSIGGYGCAGLARRVKQVYIRRAVIVIGVVGAIATAYKTWFAS